MGILICVFLFSLFFVGGIRNVNAINCVGASYCRLLKRYCWLAAVRALWIGNRIRRCDYPKLRRACHACHNGTTGIEWRVIALPDGQPNAAGRPRRRFRMLLQRKSIPDEVARRPPPVSNGQATPCARRLPSPDL